MRQFLLRLTIGMVWGGALSAGANNLTITNATLANTGWHRKAQVSFDISWENSWRDEANYDAAWVFFKYSLDSGTNWHHATLAASGTNPPGFSGGNNPDIDIIVPADRKGAFIQRSARGAGTLASSNVCFLWDLAAEGVPVSSRGRVKVMGIEMVYIPEGPFYVGDDSGYSAFYVTRISTADMTKTSGTGSGTIADPYRNDADGIGRPMGVTGTFNTNYPNGYRAFYIMKYEPSRRQYLDCVNSLTYDQATNRVFNFVSRFTPVGGTYPNYTNGGPYLAWAFTAGTAVSGWSHSLTWVDWCALRPMTEMEFEKACRGPLLPLDEEFAWGATGRRTISKNGMSDFNTIAETKIDPEENFHGVTSYQQAVAGAIRCGALATPTTDQFQAGASYYGVMELSGDVNERLVSSGPGTRSGAANAAALAFDGQHGDGELDAGGYADVPSWPGNATGTGSGFRGGDTSSVDQQARVSDRRWAAATYNYGYANGLRGVRSAY